MFENNREWNERDAQRIFAQSTTSLWIITSLRTEAEALKQFWLSKWDWAQGITCN